MGFWVLRAGVFSFEGLGVFGLRIMVYDFGWSFLLEEGGYPSLSTSRSCVNISISRGGGLAAGWTPACSGRRVEGLGFEVQGLGFTTLDTQRLTANVLHAQRYSQRATPEAPHPTTESTPNA